MNWSNFLTIFIFGIALIVLFDQGTRDALGTAVGYVLMPLIGFDNQWPILTLLIYRSAHDQPDHPGAPLLHRLCEAGGEPEDRRCLQQGAARRAQEQQHLQDEEAPGDATTDHDQSPWSRPRPSSSCSRRPCSIVIPIFAWLSVFVNDLPSTVFSTPWNFNAELLAVYIFPVWIFVYTTVTIPFGQILSRMLRYYSFKKRLDKLAAPVV